MKRLNGQALTELAIFGSIFLFCLAMLIQYGLEANYRQQADMEAFRKAQNIAFNKSGPNSPASLVLVKNKSLPDPRDQWGFAERAPILSGASVAWGTDLNSQYLKKFNDPVDPKDLPAVYFEVEQAQNKPEQAMAYVPAAAGEKTFGFYTARILKMPCPETIKVVFEDPTHEHLDNTKKTEFYEVPVKKEDIHVMRIEGGFGDDIEVYPNYELLMYPYFRYGGLKRRIDQADLDGDGKLEYIIAADENKNLLYVDTRGTGSGAVQAGDVQMNTDYMDVRPWDTVKGRDAQAQDRQGLLSDFYKEITYSKGGKPSKLVKTQNAEEMTSYTELHANQRIIHKFRLNSGEVVEIPVEFSKEGTLYNWK